MKAADAPTLSLDDWEANHAALVGRRSNPASPVPPSGEYWPGEVKGEIAAQANGFRWFLVSGSGEFRLAQSPQIFPSVEECESNLRGFSPSILILSTSAKS